MDETGDDLIRRAAEHGLFDEAPEPTCIAGRYDLVAELGRGGFGAVWRARDRTLGREVAVKLLKINEPEEVARFELEARVAAKLRHAHVVSVHDVGLHDGRPYLVMDLIDGKPLSALVGTLGSDQLGRLLAKAARGLGAAHAAGVVHRDVKPGNILVDAGGEPFVTDFGLAKPLAGESGVKTMTGAIMGTPMYMAPEQAAGDLQRISPRSDVFSLGVVLYEILAGRNPFLADNVPKILDRVQQYDPPPPSRRGKRVPVELDWVCMKALEKDPSRRYADANEFAADLERFYRGEHVTARPASLLYRAAKRVRRNPWAWGMGAAATICTLAAAYVLKSSSTQIAAHQERVRALRVYEDARSWYHAALAAAVSGDPNALELMSKFEAGAAEAVALDPSLDTGTFERARFWRLMGRDDLARRYVDEGLKAHPDAPVGRVERGLLLAGEYRRRMAAVWNDVMMLEIRDAHEEGRAPRAASAAVVEAWQPDIADLRARALADLRGADALEAADADRPWVALMLAEWDLLAGKLQSARERIGDMEYAAAKVLLGRIAEAEHDDPEALSWYAKALATRRTCWDAMMARGWLNIRLGTALREAGNPAARDLLEAAYRDWSDVRLACPDRRDVLTGLATAALHWGDVLRDMGEDPAPIYEDAVELGEAAADDDVALANVVGACCSALAQLALARGDDPTPQSDRALGHLSRTAEQFPHHAPAALNFGIACLTQADWLSRSGGDPAGTFARAIEEIERGTALVPDMAPAWRELARAYLAKGAWQIDSGADPDTSIRKAEEAMERAAALDGGSAASYYRSGLISLARARLRIRIGEDPTASLATALEQLEKAIDRGGGAGSYENVRGLVLWKRAAWKGMRRLDPQPDWRAAFAAFEAALKLDPDSLEIPQNQGGAWSEYGQWIEGAGADPTPAYQKAIETLRSLLAAHPDHPNVLSRIASSLGLLGSWKLRAGLDPTAELDEAVRKASLANERSPTLSSALLARANARLDLGTWSEARGEDPTGAFDASIADYRSAVRIDPADADAGVKLGDALAARASLAAAGREDPEPWYAEALGAYERAVELTPADSTALNGLGSTCQELAEWRAAAGRDPTDALDRASHAFARAIDIDPDFFMAHSNLGNVHHARAQWRVSKHEDPSPDFEKAIECFDKALTIHSGYALGLSNRGTTLRNWALWTKRQGGDGQGLFDRSVESLKRAVECQPDQWTGPALLGKGYELWGVADQALVWYEAAFKLNPAHSGLRAAVDRMRRAVERGDEF